MKKILITALACLMAFGLCARPHGGPGGFRPGPGPMMHHGGHHGGFWGHGGRNFWGGFGGAVLGSVLVDAFTAPVYSAPVYTPPVVVQQPAPVVVSQPQVTVTPAPVVINNSNSVVVPAAPMAQPVYRKVEKKVWVPSDVINGKPIPGHYDIVTEYIVVQ